MPPGSVAYNSCKLFDRESYILLCLFAPGNDCYPSHSGQKYFIYFSFILHKYFTHPRYTESFHESQKEHNSFQVENV